MSIPTTTSLQSLMSIGDGLSTKKHSNSQFKRAMFSSLRVKKRTERPSVFELNESRWSLLSANSLSTEDFNWSLQPNYLKMMNDTNLIDNCAAAEEEIESIRERVPVKQSQFLETNKSETRRTVDPEQLLQWIVYMEKYVNAFSPNWRQVNGMNQRQRNVSFNEQCELRQYIASHNRIFNEMIKEEDSQRTRNVQDKFHMLLLNAIEKQCLVEGYPKVVEDDSKLQTFDCPDLNLDVYKLCSIDIEPQNNLDHPDHTLIRSTESLASNSDTETIITSDDGINFPTHPTTSKSSLFSEDHCSPFSSHPDFQRDEYKSLDNIMKELDNIDVDSKVESMPDDLQKNRKTSSSSISACTLKLIENVDSVLPRIPTTNLDEYLHANTKVDNWLFHYPKETCKPKDKNAADALKKVANNICSSSSSSSDLGSTTSIQWDNFQDIYATTAPMPEELNNDFLYFGDDYDDALKSKRNGSLSSITDMIKSSTSSPTTPSKSEKSLPCQNKDETIVPNYPKMNIVSRKKRRISRKLNKKNDSLNQQSVPNDSSKMASDILLIVEDLRNNYTNLKPQDFDGILKICRENLGCLIVVLDKEQRSHYQSNESMKSVGDDRIYIRESCQCGVIGQFVARIVRFLYDCSRSVRRSAIYRFLLRILKHFYTMVKFLSHKVRVYRSLYGKY